jgi:hypothetical protein
MEKRGIWREKIRVEERLRVRWTKREGGITRGREKYAERERERGEERE